MAEAEILQLGHSRGTDNGEAIFASLAEPVSDVRLNRFWLAAYTRSRHEHQVASQLESKGLESLLPCYERLSRWSDRVRRVRTPLFPGYVFVHIRADEQVRVLQTSGVVHLVAHAGRPAVLTDSEVERLRSCMQRPEMLEPHPFLALGQRVRVRFGPFAGLEGFLVRRMNGDRLVISVQQIMRSVSIDLHGVDVEAVN